MYEFFSDANVVSVNFRRQCFINFSQRDMRMYWVNCQKDLLRSIFVLIVLIVFFIVFALFSRVFVIMSTSMSTFAIVAHYITIFNGFSTSLCSCAR